MWFGPWGLVQKSRDGARCAQEGVAPSPVAGYPVTEVGVWSQCGVY